MKSFLGQILSVFALQLSVAFVTAARSPLPYYGPISSKHNAPKHEPESFTLDVAFENFREAESKSLGDEVREILSQIVPVALTAAIKEEDSYHVLTNVGDGGWGIIQSALVRISSILYRDDLSFVGGAGGMDSSELWENACRDGRRDAAVWHGYMTNDGDREGSNTVYICPSFFEKQGIAGPDWKRAREHLCKNADAERLMKLRSAILLRELAQTSHIGGVLRLRDGGMVQETVASQSGGSQGVLWKVDAKPESKQVDVELFNLYVILTWRRSICEQQDEKRPQFDWMHSER